MRTLADYYGVPIESLERGDAEKGPNPMDEPMLILDADGKLTRLDPFRELAEKLRIFQALVHQAGNTPKFEGFVLCRLALMMLGENPPLEVKEVVEDEIRGYLDLNLKEEEP